MTAASPELHLSVPAIPENVAVARQAVASMAEAVGMRREKVADLKTVVSEAAMNTVQHAYPDADGLLELVGTPSDDQLSVTIRDFGAGIRPRPAEGDSLRLGLPLIAAMSDSFEIKGGVGRGTEISVGFSLRETASGEAVVAEVERDGDRAGAVVSLGVGRLVQPVLARVVSLLAARADLPVDRVNDAVLLADAIAAGREADFVGGSVRLEVVDEGDMLELRVGPLAEGRARRLLDAVPGAPLEVLADEVEVDEEGEGTETLTLRMSKASVAG